MQTRKKPVPAPLVRMWVGEVPAHLLKEADKLRKFKGFNKMIAMSKMLELFIEHVNNE